MNSLSSALSSHFIRCVSKPFVVAIEANIAAGKSNLMGYIKEQIEKEYGISSVKLVPEPVNEWNDVAGKRGKFNFICFVINLETQQQNDDIMKCVRLRTLKCSLILLFVNSASDEKNIIFNDFIRFCDLSRGMLFLTK